MPIIDNFINGNGQTLTRLPSREGGHSHGETMQNNVANMMAMSRKRDMRITATIAAAHLTVTAILSILFAIVSLLPTLLAAYLFKINAIMAVIASALLGLYGGVLVWSIVLFKTKLFDWTVFNVQPNWRLIVGNQVVYNELPDDDNDRTKMFEMQSLREIGSGLHGHWPTEVVFDSVDLRKEVVLVSDGGSLQCYTQDEIPLEITWQTILTPLSGYLINLSRQGEDAAIKYFRGRFETYITNWVKTKPEKIVFDCLANLEEEFKNLFGGPLNVDDTEMEYGLFTGTPQITRVKRSKRFQDAAEGRRISEIVGGSVLELTKHFGDKKPDPNLVMMASAAASQVPIEGVFLIPDIGKAGKGAQGLFAAAAAMNKKTSNQPKKDQQ